MSKGCSFCEIIETRNSERVVFESPYFLAIWDGYPVTEGHALLVSKRHIESFFSLSSEERTDVMSAMDNLKGLIDEKWSPAGFNIGINDGPEAGQTVPHLHVHLVPRYKGDVSDPRGGIRWVIPDKADYWSQSK